MFDRKKLRQQIIDLFSEGELKTLCFDLAVDYDTLEGGEKATKVVALIAHLEKRGRLPALLAWLAEERPHATWPSLETPPSSPPPVRSNDFSRPPAEAGTTNLHLDEKTGLVMVRIPAGEFLYGWEKEKPFLPEFWISKTPVTNAHYKRFIDATPKQPVPEHWDAETRTFPEDKAAHPVVFVSWFDAQAYVDWAGKWLPTEQEWEKAARGADGRKYPWGNNPPTSRLCNFDGNVGDTTPVGRYSPQGDSPYGCVDMSGNVWEWADSWFDNKKQWRVVRGGSWGKVRDLAPVVVCVDLVPHFSLNNVGFRVVSPAISGS